ncbi:hypothetical protein ACFFRR_011718 [Megaselia abdita]
MASSVFGDEKCTYSENVEELKSLLIKSGINVDVNSMDFFPGSNPGDNYMTVVKRVLVKGTVNNTDFQKNFIIKRQIPSLSRRQLYRCDEAFKNEISAYNHVIPLLKQYSGKDSPFPICFFAGHDSDGEIIILDDLKQLGFQMKNRLDDMDFEHCTVVMKELSKWHAASILSKRTNPDYEKHTSRLSEIVYCQEAEHFYKQIYNSSINDTIESLNRSNTDGQLTEPIQKLETFRNKLFDLIKKYVTEGNNSPTTVICHGDLWVNNIMFKWNSQGMPIECKFFDLQAMRCTSPAFDILHFIFTSTKRSLRDSHLTNLLNIYISSLHDEFNRNAPSEDCEAIKELFSFEMIKKEVFKYILYGLAVAMWILPAVTFDSNNIPDLNVISEGNTSPKEFKMAKQLTIEYHSRIKDLLLEFYENQWFSVDVEFQ